MKRLRKNSAKRITTLFLSVFVLHIKSMKFIRNKVVMWGCMEKSKIIMVLFVVVTLAAVCYAAIYRQSGGELRPLAASVQPPSVKQSEAVVEVKPGIKTDVAVAEFVKQEYQFQEPMTDPVLRREIIDWFASRGRFASEIEYDAQGHRLPTVYESYDEETLRQLGEGGDIRALQTLARRMDGYEDREEHRALLEKAAVYNSTWALGNLGLGYSTSGRYVAKSPEEKKAMYIEALAYYAAAQIRGDWTHAIRMGSSLRKEVDVTFTEEDELQVQKRAQEIYDDLQSRRHVLELGDFDNSIPEAVMREYEAMLESSTRINRRP